LAEAEASAGPPPRLTAPAGGGVEVAEAVVARQVAAQLIPERERRQVEPAGDDQVKVGPRRERVAGVEPEIVGHAVDSDRRGGIEEALVDGVAVHVELPDRRRRA